MSRFHPSRALAIGGNIVLGALTFLGIRTLYVHAEGLIGRDPFASLRQEENSGLAQSVGVRLGDVRVNAYRDGRLITSADADQIDVNSQDRELFTLTGIHDGVFTEDGKKYWYSANQAVWQGVGRQLTMSGTVRVRNANIDLRTDSVEFNDTMHTLATPQPISGRLYHGTLVATGFKMNTKTQEYTTGKVEYTGDLAMLGQQKDESDETTLKKWYVSGDSSKSIRLNPHDPHSPLVVYYVNGYARDDETILKGDLVTQYKDEDRIVATGNVKYFSGKADISADRATLYQREKRVVLVGHVIIYVKPKSDEDKPPVEEPLPPYKRVKPEEMVAQPPPGAEKSSTPGTGAGASVPAKGGSVPPGKGTAAPPPPSSPGGAGATAGSSTAGSSTSSPSTSATPAVTPQTPPTGAPQTSSTAGQTAPPIGAGQAAQHPSGAPAGKLPAQAGTPPKNSAQSKPETDEQKKLDEDLRSGKTVRKYPMIIVCDEVEYWYRKGQRHGHIIGYPQGRQDLPQGRWRMVWAASADYDGEKDTLTLYSTPGKNDVRMKNSKGDDLIALTLTVSTKDDADEQEYSGRKVQGVGWVETEEDTTKSDKSKTKG